MYFMDYLKDFWALSPKLLFGERRDVLFSRDDFLVRVIGPYWLGRFVLVPLPFFVLLGCAIAMLGHWELLEPSGALGESLLVLP